MDGTERTEETLRRIDPERRYVGGGALLGDDILSALRDFEARALQLRALLGERVALARSRDRIQLDFPASRAAAAPSSARDGPKLDDTPLEDLLTALLTPDALELREPVIHWPHPGHPVGGTTLWGHVPWDQVDDLAALLRRFAESFRAELVTCRHCNRRFLQSRTHGDVCHGCAERHEGLVH